MVVHQFSCLSGSGSSLSYNDYNYDNSNTNVSSHICKNIDDADRANMAKNKLKKQGL